MDVERPRRARGGVAALSWLSRCSAITLPKLKGRAEGYLCARDRTRQRWKTSLYGTTTKYPCAHGTPRRAPPHFDVTL